MKKFVSVVILVVSLIALARTLVKQPLPTVADFLAMTQGVDEFDPAEVIQECGQIINEMLILDPDVFASIWENVDFFNFFEKLGLSIGYLFLGIGKFFSGVFLSSLNLLKIPLQGLVFVLTILCWIFGIPVV